jgi:hypothetical protein
MQYSLSAAVQLSSSIPVLAPCICSVMAFIDCINPQSLRMRLALDIQFCKPQSSPETCGRTPRCSPCGVLLGTRTRLAMTLCSVGKECSCNIIVQSDTPTSSCQHTGCLKAGGGSFSANFLTDPAPGRGARRRQLLSNKKSAAPLAAPHTRHGASPAGDTTQLELAAEGLAAQAVVRSTTRTQSDRPGASPPDWAPGSKTAAPSASDTGSVEGAPIGAWATAPTMTTIQVEQPSRTLLQSSSKSPESMHTCHQLRAPVGLPRFLISLLNGRASIALFHVVTRPTSAAHALPVHVPLSVCPIRPSPPHQPHHHTEPGCQRAASLQLQT